MVPSSAYQIILESAGTLKETPFNNLFVLFYKIKDYTHTHNGTKEIELKNRNSELFPFKIRIMMMFLFSLFALIRV